MKLLKSSENLIRLLNKYLKTLKWLIYCKIIWKQKGRRLLEINTFMSISIRVWKIQVQLSCLQLKRLWLSMLWRVQMWARLTILSRIKKDSPVTCHLSTFTCHFNLSPVIHNLQHHPQHSGRMPLVTFILGAVFTEHGIVSTSFIVWPPNTVLVLFSSLWKLCDHQIFLNKIQ